MEEEKTKQFSDMGGNIDFKTYYSMENDSKDDRWWKMIWNGSIMDGRIKTDIGW